MASKTDALPRRFARIYTAAITDDDVAERHADAADLHGLAPVEYAPARYRILRREVARERREPESRDGGGVSRGAVDHRAADLAPPQRLHRQLAEVRGGGVVGREDQHGVRRHRADHGEEAPQRRVALARAPVVGTAARGERVAGHAHVRRERLERRRERLALEPELVHHVCDRRRVDAREASRKVIPARGSTHLPASNECRGERSGAHPDGPPSGASSMAPAEPALGAPR